MRQESTLIRSPYVLLVSLMAATLVNSFYNSIASGLGFYFPFNTFLFDPADVFADFFKVVLSFPGPEVHGINSWGLLQGYQLNNPYGGLEALERGELTHFHHPPLTEFVYLISRALLAHTNPPTLYLLITAAWLVPLILFIRTYFRDNLLFFVAAVALLSSYPFLMSLTRGNVGSGIVGACLIVSILLNLDVKAPTVIALLVAIASNVRPNAAIFVVLFLFSYPLVLAFRYIMVSIILMALIFLLFLASSHVIYSDYNLHTFYRSLSNYYTIYIEGNSGLAYGSSALGAIKAIFAVANVGIGKWASAAIFFVMFCLTAGATLLCRRGHMTAAASAMVLTCSYVLISGAFGDYHLLVFMAYIFYFTRMLALGLPLQKSEVALVTLVALAIMPKNYIFLRGISLQVVLNPALLFFCASYGVLMGMRSLRHEASIVKTE